MCRHRGAKVETESSGHCRVFSCLYHGWSYDLDGSLRNITYSDSFGDAPIDDLNLVQLPCEERHGFIWVVDNPDATIDVEGWLGHDLDGFLESYNADQLVCYKAGVFEEPTNWKIMHDAFLDGYHIKFAHPNSAGEADPHQHLRGRGLRQPRPIHLTAPEPRRVARPRPDRRRADGRPRHAHPFHRAEQTLLLLPDNLQVLSFYPISDDPTESRMEMRLLVPPIEKTTHTPQEWEAKWEKNWYILQTVLTGEDFPILRSIQAAYGNEVRTPTILGRNELLNQAFHREVARLRGD